VKSIRIGDVAIPLQDYCIQGSAILGIRDSGKTYAAKGIAEQLLEADVPIVVFDPIGRWRFLKMAGDDSKHPKGFKVVVAGGEAPDLPLTVQSAQEIMRAAIAENISIVLDFYDRRLSKSDWRKIVQACFRTLLFENRGVRHVFLEETAEFAPQKVLDGETYAEVEKLVRMGGNVSLGITLINQRSQEVNKAILELCENIILMRQRGSNAIDSLSKWVDKLNPGIAAEITKKLPHMGPGEAFVFTGDAEHPQLTKTAALRSFHPNRRNPHLNDRVIQQRTTDIGDFVSRLTGKLQTVVAEASANDPKKLKAENAELRKQLLAAQVRPIGPDVATVQEAKSRGFQERVDATLKKAVSQLLDMMRDYKRSILAAIDSVPPPTADARALTPAETPATKSRHEPLSPPPRRGNGALPTTKPLSHGEAAGGGKRRVMIALAQHHEGLSARKLGMLAGVKPGGSTWRGIMAQLRREGHIDDTSEYFKPTQAGLDALGAYEPLPTGEALREYWSNRIGHPARRAIFQIVCDAYPRSVPTADIAARIGVEPGGSTWRGHMAKLRGLEVVTGSKELRASEELFT
jgi:hypothetical protein